MLVGEIVCERVECSATKEVESAAEVVAEDVTTKISANASACTWRRGRVEREEPLLAGRQEPRFLVRWEDGKTSSLGAFEIVRRFVCGDEIVEIVRTLRDMYAKTYVGSKLRENGNVERVEVDEKTGIPRFYVGFVCYGYAEMRERLMVASETSALCRQACDRPGCANPVGPPKPYARWAHRFCSEGCSRWQVWLDAVAEQSKTPDAVLAFPRPCPNGGCDVVLWNSAMFKAHVMRCACLLSRDISEGKESVKIGVALSPLEFETQPLPEAKYETTYAPGAGLAIRKSDRNGFRCKCVGSCNNIKCECRGPNEGKQNYDALGRLLFRDCVTFECTDACPCAKGISNEERKKRQDRPVKKKKKKRKNLHEGTETSYYSKIREANRERRRRKGESRGFVSGLNMYTSAPAIPRFSLPASMDTKVIILQENPKKEGSKSWVRYENYKHAKTFGEFYALGGTKGDAKFDGQRGYITFVDEEAEKRKREEAKRKAEEEAKAKRKAEEEAKAVAIAAAEQKVKEETVAVEQKTEETAVPFVHNSEDAEPVRKKAKIALTDELPQATTATLPEEDKCSETKGTNADATTSDASVVMSEKKKSTDEDVAKEVAQEDLAHTRPVKCFNRVVGPGQIKIHLQVFKTHNGTGWGVRTLDFIPQGMFVCEYMGELITDGEAERRVDNDEYILDSDSYSALTGCSDTICCVDAGPQSNIARYINHACTPNLTKQPVYCGEVVALLNERERSIVEGSDWALKRNTFAENAGDASKISAGAAMTTTTMTTITSPQKTVSAGSSDGTTACGSPRKSMASKRKVPKAHLRRVNEALERARGGDKQTIPFIRLAFFAVRDIAPLEELTWDYGYQKGSVVNKRLMCLCAGPACRGYLY